MAANYDVDTVAFIIFTLKWNSDFNYTDPDRTFDLAFYHSKIDYFIWRECFLWIY